MSHTERQDVLVVLYRSEGACSAKDEQALRLPTGAGCAELLRELERVSPAMYAEIRRRILRSAGRVLAGGRDDDLLASLARQLADGGPIVFPADDDARTTVPLGGPAGFR